jgi:ribosome-associated heat shock protein Hsp15
MTAASVRLDKWLWAARFFKTRALAVAAIEGGHAEVNGDRVKRGRGVRVGDIIRVRQGPYAYVVRVTGLSERRGPAVEAARLYEETEESRAERERLAEQHRTAAIAFRHGEGKPDKKERRAIDRLKGR